MTTTPAPRWQLVRIEASTLSLDRFADLAGLHPELVRRFVALGLLDATRDAAGSLRLPRSELVTVARIQRLRTSLSLNYAALGLVLDLLDRIQELEHRSRRSAPPWTRTG